MAHFLVPNKKINIGIKPSRRTAAGLRKAVGSVEQFPPLPSAPRQPGKVTFGELGSYAEVARGRQTEMASHRSGLSKYMEMILNPHRTSDSSDLCRYPDETIVPTGVVSLQDSSSFVVPAATGSQIPGTLFAQLRWKVNNDQSDWTANSLPVVPPQLLDTNLGNFANSGTAYTQQDAWLRVSSVDRTLACGVRIKVLGVGSTFLPTGTLYAIQYQNQELTGTLTALSGPNGEASARALVAARKGFSVTMNEVSKADGMTIPYLPQGPMSYVFSDTNREAAAIAGIGPYSGLTFPPSTVVSANGGLLVVGYGLTQGQSFRIDYGHIIEFVPNINGAGLIQTAVQPPSSSMRDEISMGVASIQKTVAGSSSLGPVAGLLSGSAADAARSIAQQVLGAGGAAMRAAIPGSGVVLEGVRGMARNLGAPAWLNSALTMLG